MSAQGHDPSRAAAEGRRRAPTSSHEAYRLVLRGLLRPIPGYSRRERLHAMWIVGRWKIKRELLVRVLRVLVWAGTRLERLASPRS